MSVLSGRTTVSQYAASPKTVALLAATADELNPAEEIAEFYRRVFDIATAERDGLDVWGIIIGIGRMVQISDVDVFGFEGSGLQPWNQGPFVSPVQSSATRLEDTAYRQLLMFKAFANISNSTLATINEFLGVIFAGRGLAYAIDTGVMQMEFRTDFRLTGFEQFLLSDAGVAPKPGCVEVNIVSTPTP